MFDYLKIKKIDFLYTNQPSRRKIKVTLENNTKIYIESCHESYEQYGGITDELSLTVPVADKYNSWLHGYGKGKPEANINYFNRINKKYSNEYN